MPKSSNHLALERQWELLKLLPSRSPGITCGELVNRLAESGYKVAKRTVERDLVQLEKQFGIRCNEDSKPYQWHWLPGQKETFAGVDLADAVSLTLAEGVLKQMLPPSMVKVLAPKFEQAKEKLKSVSGHPMAKLQEKVRYVPTTLHFESPFVRANILEQIQSALVSERQIQASYAPFERKPINLRLHPLSLIQRGNVSYLAATTFDYTDVRLYAVHRFESVEELEDKIDIPSGYSVDNYLASGAMEFGAGQEIILKAKISNQLATYLAETPLHPDQKIQHKDGGYQLTAKVHDSWQLSFWILSQGAEITILSPKSLKEAIHQQLSQAAKNYRQLPKS
ncbi:helix-turn-helix transcriptional regulator [Coraliomargarita parva]|uniref:helix-turn-helix transcriptional regulator n=1 Tax=Coraliomargarita parva TaxID=3014050 RepID=UPI0022B50DE3|nr:WYL domain-containing protein [Coraliomargarita parva]